MEEDRITLVTRLLEEGKDVIPIKRGTKTPLIKWGKEYKRLTDAQVKRWFGGEQPADLALRLKQNEAVIDLDPQHDPELVATLRPELEEMTLCAESPQGGIHAYFTVEEGSRPIHPLESGGVDVLGKGSIVLIPPSTGRTYINDKPVANIRSAASWVFKRLDDLNIKYNEKGHGGPLADLEVIDRGNRNVGLTRLAGVVRKVGFRGKGLEAVLMGLNESLCYPPLPSEEVAEIAANVGERVPDTFITDGYELHEVRPLDNVPRLSEWIDGVLPTEGITLIYGLPGQGKSYIAGYFMACIEWLQPWLNRPASRRGRVVYVDWERRGLMFRRRLGAIARGMGLGDDYNYPVGYIEAKAPLSYIVEDIGNQLYLMNADVAIVDSLTIAMMGADVKEAKDVVPQLFKLHEWPCTVLVLDHQRKAAFGESVSNVSPFGSIFKDAVASNVWQVYKTYQNVFEQGQMHFTMHYHKGNYEHLGPGANINVRLDFQHDSEGQLEVATFSEADAPSPQGAILDAMKEYPREDGWELSHVMGHTGLAESTARRWLEALTKEGKLVKETGGQGIKGKWHLAMDEKDSDA